MASENDDKAYHPRIDLKYVSGAVSTVRNWKQRVEEWESLCSDEDNPWFSRNHSVQSSLESTLSIKLGNTVGPNKADHPFIAKMRLFKTEYEMLKCEKEQYSEDYSKYLEKDEVEKNVHQESAISSRDAALGQKRSLAEAMSQPQNHWKQLFLEEKQGRLNAEQGRLKEKQRRLNAEEGRLEEKQRRLKADVKDSITAILLSHTNVQNKLDRFATWGNETKTTSRSMPKSSNPRVPVAGPEETLVSVAETKTILAELKANLPNPKLPIAESSLEALAKLLVSLIDLDEVRSKSAGTAGDGATGTTKKSSSKVENNDDDETQADHVKKIVEKILGPDSPASETTNGNKALQIRQPSPKGAKSFQETTIVQPIIHAIIYRLLGVIGGVRNLYVSKEQKTRGKESDEKGRDMDFLVHEMRESLIHALPSMIGGIVEVKKCGNKEGEDDKYIDSAVRQVHGNLSKRLREELNFLGSGVDCKLYGVAVSLSKVSVVSASLENVGTKDVSVSLRHTPGVPLLTKEGLELLALALIGCVNQSAEAKHKHAILETIKGEDQSERAGVNQITIGMFLGSGGFGIVYQVDSMNPGPPSTNEVTQDDRGYFLKIPSSDIASVSLQDEAKILRLLNTEKIPNIPGCIQESSFRVTLNGFVGKTCGLLLHGMIGQPANAVDWTSRDYKGRLASVIEKVHETLRAAHEADIYHLDIRPSNIIVPKVLPKEVSGDVDILVIDWGVATSQGTTFLFRGCYPYAHDDLLKKDRKRSEAKPEYDMASLVYTFYHLHEGALPWHVLMEHGNRVCDITTRKETVTAWCEAPSNCKAQELVKAILGKLSV